MCCGLFTSIGMHTYVSWYSHERASKTVAEEKNLLNKVVILVFCVHKKYSGKIKVEPLKSNRGLS